MGRREARRVEERVHLDTLIRVRVYSGARNPTTGSYTSASTDAKVWAAVESQRSVLDRDSDGSLLRFPSAYVTRHDARWASLDGKRVTVTLDGREDTVTGVRRIGRRRFLRLEIEA